MSNYAQKIVDAAKPQKDPVHKTIMNKKRKVQEDDDYGAGEVIKFAVKKKTYLVQEATGTLSDDKPEDGDDEKDEMDYD